MMYGSAPMQGTVANAPQNVRMAFVRKVYGLFFASILVTVITGWFSLQEGVIQFAWNNHTLLWIASLICVFGMGFARRVPGLNLLLLYVFSGLIGLILGPLFFIYNEAVPGLPMQAGALATAVFGGLTLYVMLTRQDFNFLGGFLFVGLIALLVAGLVMSLFHVAALTTVYCVVGILIFSGYVLYDTSQIMTRLNYDQAPEGALSLYLDFLNLVLLIMDLLGGRRR